VYIIGADGKPWPIPEQEITVIRQAREGNLKCDPYPYLQCGTEVCVVRGPLKGYHGILVEKNKKHRLILSVHLINKSISVEIEAAVLRQRV
jgi:transcription termination/antitermination protein NusG